MSQRAASADLSQFLDSSWWHVVSAEPATTGAREPSANAFPNGPLGYWRTARPRRT